MPNAGIYDGIEFLLFIYQIKFELIKLNPLNVMNMKKKISAVLVLALGIGLASAQQPAVMVSTSPGWHKIATTTVDLTKERDEISVLGADHFSAIKLMVRF